VSDRNKTFPISVVRYDANHSFGGRAAAGVQIDLLRAFGGQVVASGGGWVALKAFHEYKSAHDDAKKQAEVDAVAAQLAGQARPDEDDDGGGASGEGGGGSSGGDAGQQDELDANAKYKSVVRKFFEFTGVVEDTSGGKGLKFHYRCLLGCGRIVTQWGPKQAKADGTWKNTAATSRLPKWLQNNYPTWLARVRM